MRRDYARKRAITHQSAAPDEKITQDRFTAQLAEMTRLHAEAEAARRAAELAEAQYRSIFEATSDGLVINDMEGYRVEVNPAFCEMHGFTREELIGTHSRVLIHHPDSLGLVEEYMAAVTQGKVFRTQAVDVRKDGTPLHVEVHGGPFTYGGKPHVLDVVRDITARVEAYQLLEQKVEERTRELSTLLESFSAIADALTSGGDFATVLQCIAEEALRLLHATSARVRVPDASGRQLILASVADDEAASIRMPPPELITAVATDPIAGEPFRTGRLRVARGTPGRGTPGAPHALYCSVPLIIRGRAHGVLVIWRTTDAPFSDDDVVIARIFGNAAALAIQEMRLLTEERDRTRELASLLEVTRNVASTLELEPLLGLVLDQLRSVAEYTSAVMVIREGDALVQVEYRGPLPREESVGLRFPIERAGSIWEIIEQRRPVMIADIWDDSPLARAYRESVGPEGLEHADRTNRSWMGIPLAVNERVIGALGLSHTTRDYYTSRHVELATAIATQAAVAIENARTFEAEQRVAERTRELATLLQISRNVASTIELQPLLGLILDQLKIVVDYSAAVLLMLEGDEYVQIEYRGAAHRDRAIGIRFPIAQTRRFGEVMLQRPPLIIPDIWDESDPIAALYMEATGFARAERPDRDSHSWMGVPLIVNDRVIGLLALIHTERDFFTRHHADLAMAIAAQAAVAIENAQLYEASNAYAALQERARLARDLHDSITQVLFSMTLHARTTLKQLERGGSDPEDPIHRNIRLLSDLAQGALAEMRMLIFELRPGALADEGLVGAVRKLAAAYSAREGIAIEVDAPAARIALDSAAEQQLYRLVQEALNNIVKHARASRVAIRMRVATDEGDALAIAITDDGVGFDTSVAYPGHIGLETMAERARAVGGMCTISSVRGTGTTVCVAVPAAVPVG